MKKFIQIGLVCGLIMGLINCRKDHGCTDPTNPKCPNYNPCSIVNPLSAAFNIYENDCTQGPGEYDTSWHYYPTDTVATNCVTFTASDTTVDSVRWTIGAGSYTQRSFYLSFANNKPASVPITLTVYKHRNSCYPTDDTVKTLTKTLYFIDTCLAFGTYQGYFDNNPADTGTISIKTGLTFIPGEWYVSFVAMTGFASGCIDTIKASGSGGNWESFYSSFNFSTFGSENFCTWISGSLYYNKTNRTVLIQYQKTDSTFSFNKSPHNFNGIKIN